MSDQLYRQSRFMCAATGTDQCPPDSGVEVAVAGRSNAGKSSVVNAICGRRALARVSRTPGRTRELLFFELLPGCRLVDLPGYGYARAPAHQARRWPAMIEGYFADRQSLHGVLVIMDCRHSLQPLDNRMLTFCLAHGLPVHVLLNKADKLSRGKAAGVLEQVRSRLPAGVTAELLSCLDTTGHEALRRHLDGWFDAAHAPTPTEN